MDKLKWAIVGIVGVLIYQEAKIERLRTRLLETNDLLIEHVDSEFQDEVDEAFDEMVDRYED